MKKKKRYGYDFTNEEEELDCEFLESIKPKTEDSTFIQFLLNRIVKDDKEKEKEKEKIKELYESKLLKHNKKQDSKTLKLR